MRLMIVCLFFLSTCFAENESWINEIANRTESEAVEWLKQNLKDSASQVNKVSSTTDCNKCVNRADEIFLDPEIFVCASFSMPDALWISLSKELEKVGGTFVLRGLPNNSFRELAEKILFLKERGVNAQIQVDPKLFQACEINSVPTFVVRDGETFDKVSGNVSVKFALKRMVTKGETSVAWHILKM